MSQAEYGSQEPPMSLSEEDRRELVTCIAQHGPLRLVDRLADVITSSALTGEVLPFTVPPADETITQLPLSDSPTPSPEVGDCIVEPEPEAGLTPNPFETLRDFDIILPQGILQHIRPGQTIGFPLNVARRPELPILDPTSPPNSPRLLITGVTTAVSIAEPRLTALALPPSEVSPDGLPGQPLTAHNLKRMLFLGIPNRLPGGCWASNMTPQAVDDTYDHAVTILDIDALLQQGGRKALVGTLNPAATESAYAINDPATIVYIGMKELSNGDLEAIMTRDIEELYASEHTPQLRGILQVGIGDGTLSVHVPAFTQELVDTHGTGVQIVSPVPSLPLHQLPPATQAYLAEAQRAEDHFARTLGVVPTAEALAAIPVSPIDHTSVLADIQRHTPQAGGSVRVPQAGTTKGRTVTLSAVARAVDIGPMAPRLPQEAS